LAVALTIFPFLNSNAMLSNTVPLITRLGVESDAAIDAVAHRGGDTSPSGMLRRSPAAFDDRDPLDRKLQLGVGSDDPDAVVLLISSLRGF